jgi:trans-aconitate 2-methyltransferase
VRHEWDASTYHRVSAPQVEWGMRVLARLPLRGDEIVIDVGCGTGRLTAELAARLPRGRVIAIDRSVEMLKTAREHLRTHSRTFLKGGAPPPPGAPEHPRTGFVQANVLDLPISGRADIIFSTATFHWVLDHPRLFGQLAAALKPGGRLHAQCGGGPNLVRLHARAQRLMREPPYAPFFAEWHAPWEFADAETTARRLREAGFDDVETSVDPAPVVLGSADEFSEFLTAVVLRDHLTYLPDALKGSFVATITAEAGKPRVGVVGVPTRADERGAGGPASNDDPPFSLDYWRLNLAGRRTY